MEGTLAATPPSGVSIRLEQRRVGWLLLAYLLLWTPLVVLSGFPGVEFGVPTQTLELIAYAIVASMMVVARRSLRGYRIDKLSVAFFVVFGTVLRTPRVASPDGATDATYFAFGLVAVVVVVAIARSRSASDRWAPLNWMWLAIGLAAGVALAMLVITIQVVASGGEAALRTMGTITTGAVAFYFLDWMGHSAILEEPVFRGFLWGFLEQRRWKGHWIWLFQAAVFWAAHIRYFVRPYTFFLALPVGALVFGWLSWKSKSVAPSLVAHAVYNALGTFL